MKRIRFLIFAFVLMFSLISCDSVFEDESKKDKDPDFDVSYSYSEAVDGYVVTFLAKSFGTKKENECTDLFIDGHNVSILDYDTSVSEPFVYEHYRIHLYQRDIGHQIKFLTKSSKIDITVEAGGHCYDITTINLDKDSYGNISKSYWGTWIEMATGNNMYVDSSNAFVKDSKSGTQYVTDFNTYHLDGDNVLTNGKYYYFRKGGTNRSFKATVSGFSTTLESVRAASVGKQGVTGRRKNKNNGKDSEQIVSGADGVLSFSNAVAEDPQTVSIEAGQTNIESKIEVTPKFDGENIGSIPIIEKGSYGFKTSYSIDSDAQGFLYGNSYAEYNLSMIFENIGDSICQTSYVEISWDDANLLLANYPSSKGIQTNFSSIEAGNSYILKMSAKYGALDKEYIDVPIRIKITDTQTLCEWNDSITLRFYKGLVKVTFNCVAFNNSTQAVLNGFFIYPDGRSKRFYTLIGEEYDVYIPWSEKDYILVFSGAVDSLSEIGYSFCFDGKASLADLKSVWTVKEINGYEPNNTTTTSAKITDLSTAVKGYLVKNDVDFYTVNNSSCEIITKK